MMRAEGDYRRNRPTKGDRTQTEGDRTQTDGDQKQTEEGDPPHQKLLSNCTFYRIYFGHTFLCDQNHLTLFVSNSELKTIICADKKKLLSSSVKKFKNGMNCASRTDRHCDIFWLTSVWNKSIIHYYEKGVLGLRQSY